MWPPGCYYKNTEGTIHGTQVLYWVSGGGGDEYGNLKKKGVTDQFAIKYKSETYYFDSKTEQGRLQRGTQVLGPVIFSVVKE